MKRKFDHRVTIMLAFAALIQACGDSLSDNGTAAPAKNVILFIGDGMGVSTVTATRIFMGQENGAPGEEFVLPFEQFPNLALVKTYNTNQQVPDSAGSGTAMHTGKKTRAGVIGLGPEIKRATCKGSNRAHLENLGERVKAHQKLVGIVTTTRITDATPGSVYAHSPERAWQSDADLPADAKEHACEDIASQLINFPFDVALGGGREKFFGKQQGGQRTVPDIALPESWQQKTGGSFIATREEMFAASHKGPLLGLFAEGNFTYTVDKPSDSPEPSLAEMTEVAINRLQSGDAGYYLMVEGGRIDHGHHLGKAGYALVEAREFVRAIEVALRTTNPEETLILVTADHSHVFSISGYPTRGNPILGLVHGNDEHGEPLAEPALAADGKPYTTLGYWNGSGAIRGERPHPEHGLTARQQAAIPTGSSMERLMETHSGEDVALYAKGPGAHRVRGVMEQNKIFDVIVNAFGFD